MMVCAPSTGITAPPVSMPTEDPPQRRLGKSGKTLGAAGVLDDERSVQRSWRLAVDEEFHGVMRSETPIGWCRTMILFVPAGACSITPPRRTASSAYQRNYR
jgi:hypothetical protein